MVPPKTLEEQKLIESVNPQTKPSELEKKYVYEVYEKIAPHFRYIIEKNQKMNILIMLRKFLNFS